MPSNVELMMIIERWNNLFSLSKLVRPWIHFPLLTPLCSSMFTCISFAGSEKIFLVNASVDDKVHRAQNNRQKLIHRAKMKSLRISVAIVAAFIICWTPYYAVMIIFMFMDPDKRVRTSFIAVLHNFRMRIKWKFYGHFAYWCAIIRTKSAYCMNPFNWMLPCPNPIKAINRQVFISI